jgi:hypothetical protein
MHLLLNQELLNVHQDGIMPGVETDDALDGWKMKKATNSPASRKTRTLRPKRVIREVPATFQYNPTYEDAPLADFASVNPSTPLSALNLNWRERDLPERERTKHVHRLHPYLGKFIPQLAEVFLRKYAPDIVCDPFMGSGTTLVEANALGIPSVGCDISSFNCLLATVKTAEYDIPLLWKEIHDILLRLKLVSDGSLFANVEFSKYDTDNKYLRQWYAEKARQQLIYFRSLIPQYKYQDVLKIILSRAARSARLTTHFDLDFPKKPQTEPYHCYKHGRICHPSDDAMQFLTRYSEDTLKRIIEFSKIRTRAPSTILHGDSREIAFPEHDCVMTSPPYVGLIDYHEQHRYAYELLGLENNEKAEIGAAARGSSKKATEAYKRDMIQVFSNIRRSLDPHRGRAIVVVNDKFGLYEYIAKQSGFVLEGVVTRHVNRRTGRRFSEFFEQVLIWRVA